jgi:Protein of unknown function (DUF4232)
MGKEPSGEQAERTRLEGGGGAGRGRASRGLFRYRGAGGIGGAGADGSAGGFGWGCDPGVPGKPAGCRGLGTSAAAGTAIVAVRVTNVSARGCRLEGRPVVTFLDAAGRALPVAESALAAACTVDGYPYASLTGRAESAVLAYRAGQANALLPGPAIPRPVTLIESASASAAFATAAPGARGAQCRVRSELSVALPGGSGTLRISRAVEVCGAAPGAGAFVAGSGTRP